MKGIVAMTKEVGWVYFYAGGAGQGDGRPAHTSAPVTWSTGPLRGLFTTAEPSLQPVALSHAAVCGSLFSSPVWGCMCGFQNSLNHLECHLPPPVMMLFCVSPPIMTNIWLRIETSFFSLCSPHVKCQVKFTVKMSCCLGEKKKSQSCCGSDYRCDMWKSFHRLRHLLFGVTNCRGTSKERNSHQLLINGTVKSSKLCP